MKTYRVNGSHIKRLRELLRSGATQKELAFAVGIGERQLRNIENNSAIIKRDVLDRLARHLGFEVKEIAYAVDGPRLVPSPSIDCAVSNILFPTSDYLQPRYDTGYASATMDADKLLEHASGSRTVVCTIETKLTAELSRYASEIMKLLCGLSWSQCSIFDEIPEDVARAIKRRIRELLVLLKGNDVWVYETWVLRRLPECDELPPGRSGLDDGVSDRPGIRAAWRVRGNLAQGDRRLRATANDQEPERRNRTWADRVERNPSIFPDDLSTDRMVSGKSTTR